MRSFTLRKLWTGSGITHGKLWVVVRQLRTRVETNNSSMCNSPFEHTCYTSSEHISMHRSADSLTSVISKLYPLYTGLINTPTSS